MRAIRILLATALTISAAAVVSATAAGADGAPSYTAVTGSGDPIGRGTGPFAYTGDAVAVTPGATTEGITFTVATTAASPLIIKVAAPSSGPLVADHTTYATSAAATATSPGLDVSEGGTPCSSAAGTLRIDELTQQDLLNPTITAFSAHYTLACGENISGELRFQSTRGYSAFTQSASSWDFGTQAVKQDGWAKTFTFTNRGTSALAFSSVGTGTSVFAVKANTCTSTTPVAVGARCTVRIAPHPTSTSTPVNGALRLVPSGGSADLAAPTVNLRVLGSDAPSLFAVPGPERVELDWNQLPTPIGAGTVRAAVYRGRSASKLALYRNITGTVFVDHPTPGHTYYYAVAPRLSSGTLGDRSPAVAAMAWPKYGAGMYHRFGNGARFAASVLVRAGHPYSLKILGRHGVPASHVSAVSLNVTAASPTAGTNIYVYPAGGRRPAAADLAVRRGDTRSNFVLAQVGKSGRILLATSHGSVRLTVDASGYFSGSGLSSRYGMGAALHMSGEPVTALDTKGWHLGPVPAGYAARGGVEFRSDIAPHVTSLLVEVTAYGSKGSGSISAFADGRRAPSATVLTYRPNVTTSSAAIVNFAGSYSNGESITSTWFLNRGKKSVHLHVAVLGYFDDNTLDYGQRYIPTAPVHLYGGTLHAGTSRTVAPGRHGNYWTSAFNLKIAASKPSAASTISVRPIGFGSAPAKGQLHTSKKVDVVSSTISVSGTSNRFAVRNSAGSVRVDVWSFGRFDCYPFPAARGYASTAGPAAASTTAGPLRRIA